MQNTVCGTGLGDTAGLASIPFMDISTSVPTPPPNTYAGLFILRLTPGCEHGDNVRIVPPSAARIVRQAPAADGLAAGVRIESYATDYQVIGTGAVPFVEKVDVPCVEISNHWQCQLELADK